MDGLIEAAVIEAADIVVTAFVGMIGIVPTIEAIKAGKDIALANKETLVTAGHIIIRLAEEMKVKILPVDSEHSAIFQCLHGESVKEAEKILLTASGGPFRGWKKEQMKDIIEYRAMDYYRRRYRETRQACWQEVFRLTKKKNEITIRSSAAEYLTYVASVGEQQDSIEMRYEDENIWLTQKMMALLYNVGTNTINYHIKKVFGDSELQENSVIRKFRITAADGKSYSTNHYSLEMIIAVGFKVNSERAVQFRKWVNQIAKDYTIKGWVMDDERLKNGGSVLTTEYFDRLLEQIREIRLSERRFYQKITDIYATALDYDRTAKTTKQFFAKVQNKMHYAVHGHTAAELIYERADAEKPHMGLTTWAAAPEGKIVKSDVTMRSLERIVSAYLDLAEDRAERHIPMTMEDWSKRLDLFLMADDREILQDAGKITAEIAKAKAETEFEKYRIVQDRLFMSDFDRYMLELENHIQK